MTFDLGKPIVVALFLVFAACGCDTTDAPTETVPATEDRTLAAAQESTSPANPAAEAEVVSEDSVQAIGSTPDNVVEDSAKQPTDQIRRDAFDFSETQGGESTIAPVTAATDAGEAIGEKLPSENPPVASESSPVAPIPLVAGEPIPGERLIFPQVTVEGDGFRMEVAQSELIRVAPPEGDRAAQPIQPGATIALATTAGFQLGIKRDRIDFEVRPEGGKPLALDAVIQQTPITGPSVVEYRWRDQPYEILDRNLRVVFSHPDNKALGQQRKPLAIPEIPNPVDGPPDLLAAPEDFDMKELTEQEPAEDVQATEAEKEEAARKAAAVDAAKWRTWTSADGNYRLEAKFVKLASGMLTLEKKDGTTVDVKLDLLNPEDQQFVIQRKWTRSASKQPAEK